jgi:hypothetical protein
MGPGKSGGERYFPVPENAAGAESRRRERLNGEGLNGGLSELAEPTAHKKSRVRDGRGFLI